jgi:hypothetical protein
LPRIDPAFKRKARPSEAGNEQADRSNNLAHSGP